MERDCQENIVEVDHSMKATDSEIRPFENMDSYHRVKMDGQLDADNYIPEEHFDGSLTISEPKYMMQTESSKRKSKLWNQTDSSPVISNEGSSFLGKPGIRASGGTANAKTQGYLAQPHKDSSSQQVKAQESTSQPTKNPNPSQRSTSSTSKPSTLASTARPNQGNPPSQISSPTITNSQAHKNSVPRQGETQQIAEQSAKNHPTPAQRSSKLQVNSEDTRQTSTSEPNGSRNLVSPETSRNLIPHNSTDSSRDSPPTSPIYYISCDGYTYVKTSEPFTEKCVICERDLPSSFKDWEIEYYDEHKDDIEPKNLLPNVAVLGCGHVFHSECLDLLVAEDQSSDPLCFICLSSCTSH